jgi:hypothetical protein
MNTNVIGLDLAKNIFHLFSFNLEGKPMKKKVKNMAQRRLNHVATFEPGYPPLTQHLLAR